MGFDPCGCCGGSRPFPGCPFQEGSLIDSLPVDVNGAPLDFTLFSGCNPNFPAQAMAEIPNGNLSCLCFFWPQFRRFVLISLVGSGLWRFIQGIKE